MSGTRHASTIAAGLLAAMLCLQLFWYERDIATWVLDWPSIAFVGAFVLLLTSLFALVSKRLFASVALACGLLVLTTIVSVVKYSHMRASLYAADVYTYATWKDLQSFTTKFLPTLLVGLAVIVVSFAIAWFLFVTDRSRIRRRHSGLVLVLGALLLFGAYQWRGDRGKIHHYFAGHHVSAVVASVPEALTQGGFLEAADRGGTIDSEPIPRISPAKAERHPTIISILHESSFPTGIFPIQCGGRAPKALYTSSNGATYDLQVETYNGSTWMTEYGLLLGLSTYYLGDNRIWLGFPMENRIHDSLALQMRRNGYNVTAVYPSHGTFVNTERFYRSVGVEKVLDYVAIGASSEFERDRFYYGKVLDQIREHKASGSKAPLYVMTWINATHAPFDFVRHPGVAPDPASICAKDGEWAEYIRRLLMSEDDLAWLNDKLRSEFPDEPFMILGFGDHHPHLSREFLQPNGSNPFTPNRGSLGYKTFFRITGIGFEPDWASVPQSIDAPFLGSVLMAAARLTRFGFYNDRDKLMRLCAGRYADCPHQDEVLSFHQRLVTSSMVESR